MNLTIEQKAALFDRAVAEGRIFYLNDMSTTLERDEGSRPLGLSVRNTRRVMGRQIMARKRVASV